MASFYFDKDAKRRINESVTALDVVQLLGVPTKRIGNRVSILCPSPEHSDSNFGSCSIDSKGNCYCYVCRKRFTPIDMMMNIGGYSLYDAVTALAEYTGCQSEYVAKNLPKEDPLMLTREEKELLGLQGFSRTFSITGCSDRKPKDGKTYIVRGEEYLLIEYTNEGDRLRQLLENERDVYIRLIRDKIKEKTMMIRIYASEFGKDDPEVQKEYFETIGKLKKLAERFANEDGRST